jgi:hypothetical protein
MSTGWAAPSGSFESGIPVPPRQGGWCGVTAKPGRCPGLSHRAPSGQVPQSRAATRRDAIAQGNALGTPGEPWIPALKGPDVPHPNPADGRFDRGKDSSHRMDQDVIWRRPVPSARGVRMGHPGAAPSGRMVWGHGETRALPWPISSGPFRAGPAAPRRNAARCDSPRQRLGDPGRTVDPGPEGAGRSPPESRRWKVRQGERFQPQDGPGPYVWRCPVPSARVVRIGHSGAALSGRMVCGHGKTRALP